MEKTKSIIVALMLLFATWSASGYDVTLAWDHSPDLEFIERYELLIGTDSREYTLVVDAGLNDRITVLLPHPGYWYFSVIAVGTNQLASDYSNEVMHLRALVPPRVRGQRYVKLTPVAEFSTNLIDWVEQDLEPTYIPATNAVALYRGNRIEVIDVVEGEPNE